MNDPTETRVLNYETSALYVQGEAPVKGAYSLRPRGKKSPVWNGCRQLRVPVINALCL